ncbi:MAG: hypothetical protein QM677_10065 [Microbacterium sp.]
MAGVYAIGGNFLADGSISVTYSEMYDPGSGAILDTNANEREQRHAAIMAVETSTPTHTKPGWR